MRFQSLSSPSSLEPDDAPRHPPEAEGIGTDHSPEAEPDSSATESHSAPVPRRVEGDEGFAQLVTRTVRLIFQRWPGTAAESGIEGLHFRIRGSRPRSSPMISNAQGEISFRTPSSAQTLELLDPDNPANVWGTYLIMSRTGLPDIDDANFEGVRCRLNMLGYNAGEEGTGSMDQVLERAVLQFEADNGLTIEGVLPRFPRDEFGEARRPALLRPRIMDETKTRLAQRIERAGGADSSTSEAGALRGVGGQTGIKAVYRWERLVLVRFTRAIRPQHLDVADYGILEDNPELDDRGYQGSFHGPAVGMLASSTASPSHIYVRLLREDIGLNAPLFVVSQNPSLVRVDPSGVLPNAQAMDLRLQAGSTGGDTLLAVKLGSVAGPTIHELKVFVHEPITLPVSIWRVRITRGRRTVNSTINGENVQILFDTVNKCWRPAGVQFNLAHFEEVDDGFDVSGYRYDADSEGDISHLMHLKHRPDEINIYAVEGLQYLEDSGAKAAGFGPQLPVNPDGLRGVVMRNDVVHDPHALAHELGHYLGLHHPENEDCRVSSWAMRRLMFNFTEAPPPTPDWQHTIGWTRGSGRLRSGEAASTFYAGNLLTLKELHDPAEMDSMGGSNDDGEVWRVRELASGRAGSPYDGIRINT